MFLLKNDDGFQRLPNHRVALPACSKQTAGAIVADFSSKSSHGVGHCACYEEWSRGDAGLQSQSYSARFERSGAAQIAPFAHPTPSADAARAMRIAQRLCGAAAP